MVSTETLLPPEPLKVIQQNFLQELRNAHVAYRTHTENKTSLPFIVNQVSSSPLVRTNEPFQTLVIGGTIGRKALFRKTEKGIEIIRQEEERELPSLAQMKEFLEFIDDSVDPKIRVVGINFAYPMKSVFEHGKLDGILLETSREKVVSAQDLIGKKLGEKLRNICQKKEEHHFMLPLETIQPVFYCREEH